jgi:hypothetical protein
MCLSSGEEEIRLAGAWRGWAFDMSSCRMDAIKGRADMASLHPMMSASTLCGMELNGM